MITPWTNEEQTVFAPLNDYTATVIGIVRDEYDFRRILTDDILYTGNAILPVYAPDSNAHYEAMTDQNTGEVEGEPAAAIGRLDELEDGRDDDVLPVGSHVPFHCTKSSLYRSGTDQGHQPFT